MSTALAEIYEQSAADWLDQFNRALSRASREESQARSEWLVDHAIDVWGKAQRNLVEAKEQRDV